MFSDSTIASEYKMSASKVKYSVVFGIAPFLKEILQKDIENIPFVFKFDETTTSQKKKQLDGYVQFFSKSTNKVVTRYAGSYFVGHCNSENLYKIFEDFGKEKLKWDVNYLLHLGMDGPNVNISFQNILKKELLKKNKIILNVGSCPLHIIHNCFLKGLAKVDFDYDGFPHDVWFFFKYSSARREDYKLSSLCTDIDAHNLLRHVNSRWLSLKKVYMRIIDQWPNLIHYFTVFLPKEKNFVKDVASSSRYKRIVNVLKDTNSKIYIYFAIHVADLLERFLLPFQTNAPKIHDLFIGFSNLFFDLMSQFVKAEKLISKDKTRKKANELGKLKLDSEYLKNIHEIDYGSKIKYLIAEGESKINYDSIKLQFKSAYVEMVKYLQLKLPHDSQIIKDLQYINPRNKNSRSALDAIERLSMEISSVLKNTSFIKCYSIERYIDNIKMQFQYFQTENIPYEGLIDEFWTKLLDYKMNEKYAFKELSELALTCLSLSHSNVVPEQGFSLNKYIIQNKESIDEITIEAVRMVKDFILSINGIEDFPINRRLFEVCIRMLEFLNQVLTCKFR